MPVNWNRVARTAISLGRRYGPTIVDQARTLATDRGLPGTAAAGEGGRAAPGGRPATTSDAPSSSRGRHISYSPDLDGRADPGEIVWTWVEFEEHDGRGKDRPVLVVGRDERVLLGLQFSSKVQRAHEPGWLSVGRGAWDPEGRESVVRLDRVLEVPEAGIRREGAICPREVFDRVAERLRSDYGWS